MEYGFTTAAYVVSVVLFILSLGGLSGQESAKRAVWYGITGMALAIAATLIGPGSGLWFLSMIMIAGGGYIGYQLATKVQMTQMPELVAAMHSLVGLAAVFVGFDRACRAGSACWRWTMRRRRGLKGFAAIAGQERRRRDRHSAGRVVPWHLHRRDHVSRVRSSRMASWRATCR